MASPPAERPSAVALSHAARDQAPIVVAKGYGDAAEAIIRCAREHGLYVHAAPDLVKLLMHVDLDARIPPQLYVAIAEILAWLYQFEAVSSAQHDESDD
ncbi:MAG: EscU/YscU/HrcU family type III secretion system export apparatus switch protein [Rhodoferax sp.]|uniref:EscU/YscU/HrcU family type III secretion system export apparatus switch protein n=1 Tax=Rhodoferax sp. TaxID=50421 RepID=UPI003BB5852A